MKIITKLLTILIAVITAVSLTGCAVIKSWDGAGTPAPAVSTTAEVAEGAAVPEGCRAVCSASGGFSTVCSTEYRVTETDGSLCIFPTDLDVPVVTIRRVEGVTADSEYVANYAGALQEGLGERFQTAMGVDLDSAGTLYELDYSYTAGNDLIESVLYFENRSGGCMLYFLEQYSGTETEINEIYETARKYMCDSVVYNYTETEARSYDFTVTRFDSYAVSYEEYDNGSITMQIPEGWEVCTAGDCTHYGILVYDPEEPSRQLCVLTKLSPLLKSQAAKDYYTANPGDNEELAEAAVLEEESVECLFSTCINAAAEPVCDILPQITDFEVIEELDKSAYGGEVLYATAECDGEAVSGLFTAVTLSAGEYEVYADAKDLGSGKVDIWYYNVYNAMLLTAPEGELIQWEAVLTECLSTIAYSSEFVQEFYEADTTGTQRLTADEAAYKSVAASLNAAWSDRGTAYDIMRQKQQDSASGVCRIYDYETGEIYLAPEGCLDGYSGSRYMYITEQMYLDTVDGEVE